MSAPVPRAFAGPRLYGLVLRYRLTGALPSTMPAQKVALIRQLAEASDVVRHLMRLYPGSRLREYHAVARDICTVAAAAQEPEE